ncbi:UNVERIFIED_ORG: hypothetical protein QE446_004624, partial [Rhizobium sp. SORGH_AS260]|nr:hypothetical protein [Rhizobium sp. SORGH_AS_0260]
MARRQAVTGASVPDLFQGVEGFPKLGALLPGAR